MLILRDKNSGKKIPAFILFPAYYKENHATSLDIFRLFDARACCLLRADLNKRNAINPCRSPARLLSKMYGGNGQFCIIACWYS